MKCAFVFLSLAVASWPRTSTAQVASAAHARPQLESLSAIVGVWQSDTVKGSSAVSNCAWTRGHAAVVCDQTVRTPNGPIRALSLFTFDAAGGTFVFYGLAHPGEQMHPLPLSINGKIWTYGGDSPGADGRWSRTINDFSAAGSYEWRQETSANGKQWTVAAKGRARQLR
jgi:hypothetical protein